MEQKTINQNKLQTLLCIIALTLGVLVSAVLFSMPPVHASNGFVDSIPESHMSFTYFCSNTFELYNEKNANGIVYPYTTKEEKTVFLPDGVYFTFVQKSNNKNTRCIDCPIDAYFVSQNSFQLYYYTNNNRIYKYDSFYSNATGLYFLNSTFLSNAFGSVGQLDTWEGGIISDASFSNSIFYYDTDDALNAYLKKIVDEKIDTSISPNAPNTTDESYTFTGFSINGKTARWTGTTERSYAKEVDVEEYVKVSYAWATTTEPDNLGELQSYDGEFPTSDKRLTLPWSEMENGKTDFQFIRQVKIFPCYRVPHLAYYIGQPVTIFYNPNGTIDKIEQATIPTDSETIGNDISLIGFRYDNSFHAEWVDVWSNAVNKSAFDLDSGGQYLSLGIKAIYYDGSKADIDFYSLDRKKLTWDKAFSDFKENNGSSIKSLYFTPYTKTGVNNPWNKGNSIVVNFDENGNASSSFDTGDDGTVHLNDFKLTGVVWNKPVVQSGTITWTGTTPNSDLLFIPDSDTLVVATYPRYDSDMNTSYETWSTTTIGKGSMKVNVDYLIDYYKNNELAWNGEMWLTPCYKKGGVLYMGEPVIINCLKGTVSDIVVDKDSGKAEQVDKTDQNKSDADSILNVGNQFYSIINSLIGSLQQLPALLTAIFGFLPSSFINLIYASFAAIIICRILGR